MNRCVRSFPSMFLLFFSSAVCFSVFASEDDFVVDHPDERVAEDDEIGVKIQGVVAIRNLAIAPRGDAAVIRFENMIFSQDGSAEIGDHRIRAEREQTINSLNRAVRLTDAQKRKLDLAGQIDRQRFFDQVKAASQNTRVGLVWTKEDQKAVRKLQAKTTTGLLGPGSFFAKSIPIILNNDQLALLYQGKRSIHRDLIKNALRDLETRLTLSEQQRESLTQIMLDEIPYDPTSENGELLVSKSERMMMKYRLSRFAARKLESVFDPLQWQKVRPLLEEWYHYQDYLVDRGLLDFDADVAHADDPAIRMKEPK
jgi:hypothetical protein